MMPSDGSIELCERVDSMLNQFNDNMDKYYSFVTNFLKEIEENLGSEMRFSFINWEERDLWSTIIPVCLSALNLPSVSSKIIVAMRPFFERYLYLLEAESLVVEAEKMNLRIMYDRERNNFRISVFDFTKYCSKISGSEYRLVLQSFDKGEVITGKNSVCKMLRERFVADLREKVMELDYKRAQDVMNAYSDSLKNIHNIGEELSKKVDLGAVETDSFPPCIKRYITDIQASVNLPHLARFTLVSFLHNIGMDESDVMKIFSNVPDFSKKITEYQVKHIIGEISGTEYTPPKCETIRSNHLCYQGSDPICAMSSMKHPLSYYRIKKKAKKKV